ncbi:hypothetical protein, partial [Alistipes finegoldii]|uniref:hypothetical protein n=1 Tax=Alistipes finegoldii TaxID=214856 RepID=UPI0026DA8A45
ERLLDKQEVSGSNPLVPTNENQTVAGVRLSFSCPRRRGGYEVCVERVDRTVNRRLRSDGHARMCNGFLLSKKRRASGTGAA